MVRRAGLVLILAAALMTGCIQPVSNADLTRTAIGPVPPTNPPVVVPTNPPAAIPTTAPGPVAAATTPALPPVDIGVEQFILSRGEQPGNLQVWYDQPFGTDRLQGFSYTNAAGLRCAGFLLTIATVGTNGAPVCAPTADTTAIAAVTVFAASDGLPYTIVFGRVDDAQVTSVAAIYSDGTSLPSTPFMGGFLIVKAGVLGVNQITAVDALGNTVIGNIPQTPV